MRDHPFTFSCCRSGNCCSRPGGEVRVSQEEATAIAAHLKMSRTAFGSRYLRKGEPVLLEAPSGACVFLEEGRRTSCSIYPERPKKCRSWPHWPELRESPERLREAQRLCPGIVLNPDAAI